MGCCPVLLALALLPDFRARAVRDVLDEQAEGTLLEPVQGRFRNCSDQSPGAAATTTFSREGPACGLSRDPAAPGPERRTPP